MAFSDSFFKKVEQKTNVDKDTILSLASKLQNGNMKNEDTLKEVIQDIARITGREVSKEKEKKIIDTVLNEGVPKDLNKYLDQKIRFYIQFFIFLFNKYYITYINNVNLFASNILLIASFCDIMMQIEGE